MTGTREALAELITSTLELVDAFQNLPDDQLVGCPTGHACAHGGDVWQLIANMTDHEDEHAGQLAGARHHHSPEPRTATQRLLGEWLEARTRFAIQLAGMSDEVFNSPMRDRDGEWTYADATRHLLDLQRHVLATLEAEREAREASDDGSPGAT